MTSSIVKAALGALILAGAAWGASSQARAMPALNGEALRTAPEVENVRWVCGQYRCWWRPNYAYGGYGYYGPPAYVGGYPRQGWGHSGWGHHGWGDEEWDHH